MLQQFESVCEDLKSLPRQPARRPSRWPSAPPSRKMASQTLGCVNYTAGPLLPCNCRDGRRGHPGGRVGGRPKLDCHIGPLVVFHAEKLPPPPYYPTTASIAARTQLYTCAHTSCSMFIQQVLIHFARSTIHSNFLLLEVTIILRHQKLVNYLSNLCQFWKTPDIPVLHVIGKVFIFKTSN